MYEFSQDYEELAHAVIDALWDEPGADVPDILVGNGRTVIPRE